MIPTTKISLWPYIISRNSPINKQQNKVYANPKQKYSLNKLFQSNNTPLINIKQSAKLLFLP